MTAPSPSRGLTRRSSRPGLAGMLVLLLAFLLLATGLLLAGCAGTTTTATPEEVTAEGLAAAVVDTWVEAMQELVALLEDKPEAAAVLPQVEELKEEYVLRFVALGHQRETLSDSGNSQASALEWSAFTDLADETWYAGYNNLTQYSEFDLLKEQLPEEAVRLGIE